MKVVFRPAPGAVLRVRTRDGKTLDNDDVESVEVEPYFPASNATGEALVVESRRSNGSLIEPFLLVVSGQSGKARKVVGPGAAKKKVVPLVDRPKAKPGEPTAQPEQP